MDQPQQEPTLEESLKEVLKTLPPVIRDYLVQQKYTPVAQRLASKYSLRIDQAGVLEREIMLLLMGVETPGEFVQALATDARLEESVINGLAQDVNDMIFLPLRKEEEEKGIGEAGAASSATPRAVPMTPAPAPRPSGLPANGMSLPPRSVLPTGTVPSPSPLASMDLHQGPVLSEGLPGVVRPVTTEFLKTPGASVMPPQRPPVPPAPPVTSYTTDPYREPVDDLSGAE